MTWLVVKSERKTLTEKYKPYLNGEKETTVSKKFGRRSKGTNKPLRNIVTISKE